MDLGKIKVKDLAKSAIPIGLYVAEKIFSDHMQDKLIRSIVQDELKKPEGKKNKKV